MGFWLLLIVIIGVLVVYRLLGGGRSQGTAMQQTISVLGKIKFTLDWLNQNLDSSKLDSGKEKYVNYFVSYFDECARAICEKSGVEYHDGNRFLVYVETAKRCGGWKLENEATTGKAKALLEQVKKSEPGERGAVDGKKDGVYVAEPSNPGPYYNLAREYFGLPPAEQNRK